MTTAAAIFDLDRTLISTSSSTVFQHHLVEAGVTHEREIPGLDAFYKAYELFGENLIAMQVARLAVRAASGWSVEKVAKAANAAAGWRHSRGTRVRNEPANSAGMLLPASGVTGGLGLFPGGCRGGEELRSPIRRRNTASRTHRRQYSRALPPRPRLGERAPPDRCG